MLREDVLIGGEESGGISFKGHIPEGDGILMGLLLVEMVATSGKSLSSMVKELLADVGPAYYERRDLRLKHPVAKKQMTSRLENNAPDKIGGMSVSEVQTVDGVKYIIEEDSWLLIRPSGTEPVLRVYAEGRSEEMRDALISYGEEIASNIA
jgi:phosphomannomutase